MMRKLINGINDDGDDVMSDSRQHLYFIMLLDVHHLAITFLLEIPLKTRIPD